MIKKIWLTVASCLLMCFSCSAGARVLCDPPLQADCIMPQWGQIESDSEALNSDGQPTPTENRSATTNASSLARSPITSAAHIRLAQMSTSMKTPHPPELFIGSGKRFEGETRTLVRAIERATFDASGNLKSGQRMISAAAEALRVPSKNNQLNLYIKTPTTLSGKGREVLMTKVHSINEIIEHAASDSSYPKKQPNS
ncbi:MAG: hypothetical protein ACR2GP_07300 [Burkholderiaceae bacterium]